MTSETNWIKEAWMRDFSYADYVSTCMEYEVVPVSVGVYHEECALLEAIMWNDVEHWKGTQ